MVTASTAISGTLAINELVHDRVLAGEQIVHLAFGEAGLPVPSSLLDLLREGAATNGYGPVAGPQPLREAVAGYLGRRGVPSHADLIAMTPGSKPALFALLSSIAGDVVIPRPSWVSYAAQAALAGRNVLSVPIGDGGGVPDPVALEQALDRARAQGLTPGILVVTVPDNPTGTVASAEQIKRVMSIAVERGLTVISDEIYRDLTFDPERLLTPGMVMPDRVIVTGGLSKSVALGGWRIGFARFPDTAHGRQTRARVLAIASEVWSCIASPMGEVARHVFDEPPEVQRYVASARRLHESVSRRVHELFLAAGAQCRTPEAAFYVYPDLGPVLSGAARRHAGTAAELARFMLDELGIAVLPGEAFGDDASASRFRVATSLLYGRSDTERWTAMQSSDPTALPWIAAQLQQIEAGLATLTDRSGHPPN